MINRTIKNHEALLSMYMSHIRQDLIHTLHNSDFADWKAKYLLDHTHYLPLMFHDIQLSYDGDIFPILIKLSL